MSAWGQKQTFATQTGMSALPPKAAIGPAQFNVCFGQKADIRVDHSIQDTYGGRHCQHHVVAQAASQLMVSLCETYQRK